MGNGSVLAVLMLPTDRQHFSLRLATHLFAESLLDKDHYFEWLLNTINQVDIETLPVYLLIIKSHLKEVGQSRRYGRRLAESLSEQLHRVFLVVLICGADADYLADKEQCLAGPVHRRGNQDCEPNQAAYSCQPHVLSDAATMAWVSTYAATRDRSFTCFALCGYLQA